MSKISLEGIASKMSANQMKSVTGGCAFTCTCGGRTTTETSMSACCRRCGVRC